MLRETIRHPLPPVFDAGSRVLILGTMPSPVSRERAFYYMHPQNRFWPVLGAVLGESVPREAEERRALALRHGIAIWDVLASCSIQGAGDQSIRDAVPNDVARLIFDTQIQAVFTTGKAAWKLYQRFCAAETGIDAISLPSPSAANCAMSLERLAEEYRRILPWLIKP